MSNSMINPSVVDLLTKTDDRYSLVIVTSKRARQLIEGREKLIEEDFTKPLTTAINEVEQGAVKFTRIEIKE